MLLSSMDHLNYYSMPKESFLEIDTARNDGYSLQAEELGGGVSYLNEENSPKNGTKSSLYKTELCKRFSEFGNCRYGAKCQFAHGLAELRHVVRHPKYKTTKCKSYWGSGHCPYGSRCRFIHEEAEGYSQPQFSPPAGMSGGMGNMFMHEKDHHLSSMGSMLPPLSDLGTVSPMNYLYGNNNNNGVDHLGTPSLPSYPKDYSLMSSFDKSAWGSRPTHSKLSYAGDHFGSLKPTQPGPIGSAPLPNSTSATSPSYPDLQDAIDALMKFSLSPSDNNEPSVLSSTSPVHASKNSPDTRAKKPDFSLESDELWKDFPSVTSSAEKRWSSPLVLNLESKPFDASDKKEPSNNNDEESPRLSVFERFH